MKIIETIKFVTAKGTAVTLDMGKTYAEVTAAKWGKRYATFDGAEIAFVGDNAAHKVRVPVPAERLAEVAAAFAAMSARAASHDAEMDAYNAGYADIVRAQQAGE